MCTYLWLPSIFGLLLRSSDSPALAPYSSLSSATVLTLPSLTASPVLRYPFSEMPAFFLNCPFIMPPPHKVSKKPRLLPDIIKHMWRMLTCKGCNKSSSFLSDRNRRATGLASLRGLWRGSGQGTEEALGCCGCCNSSLIWHFCWITFELWICEFERLNFHFILKWGRD